MNANPYPTDLTDAEWDLIKNLIPPPKPGGRHRELEMRAVVNAIFYGFVANFGSVPVTCETLMHDIR